MICLNERRYSSLAVKGLKIVNEIFKISFFLGPNELQTSFENGLTGFGHKKFYLFIFKKAF